MLKNVVFTFVLIFLPVKLFSQDQVLTILYTGGIKGELEPCGCSPKTESGGLARLSGYILANKEKIAPYILIDAGNSMSEDTPQGRLKAEALLKSFDIIGFDAIAVFKNDTLLPKDFFAHLIEKHRVLFVSGGNISIKAERGLLGINISTEQKSRKDGMLNILLTDRPVSEAKSVNGWDVIITSSGEILEELQKVNGGIIVSGYPRGQKLGILTLEVDSMGRVTSVNNRWQTLSSDINEDERVRNILKEYDAKVAGLLKDEERKVSAESPYLGVAGCLECHQPFIETWKNTKHADAFRSLEKVGKSKDPECVKCHTTGYSQEGGFYSATTTSGLANVQCEVCHGPGKEHIKDFSVPIKPINESLCLNCHTKDNSPDFNFKSYLERIKHKEN